MPDVNIDVAVTDAAGNVARSQAKIQIAQAYTPPPSIPFDGSADVTRQLTDWLSTVPDGPGEAYNTVQFPPGAVYRIDGTEAPVGQEHNHPGIKLRDRHWLIFDGQGAALDGRFTPRVNTRLLVTLRGDHLIFKNLTLRGANPLPPQFITDNQWGHTMSIQGSNNVLIDRIVATDAWGDGIGIQQNSYDPPRIQAHHITIQNSTVFGTGRMTIAITTGDDIIVQDNILGPAGWSIFDVEPEAVQFTTNRIQILRNHTKWSRLGWFANGGYCNKGCNDITISENVMDEAIRSTNLPLINVITPVGCPPRSGYRIDRNRLIDVSIQTPYTPTMEFRGAGIKDSTIEKNTVTAGRRLAYGVALTNATGFQIRDNAFNGAAACVNNLGNSQWEASGNTCSGVPCP